jgi:geranylgeranyl pyrophosphate synthase
VSKSKITVWLHKPAQLLGNEIETVLASLPDVAGLRNMVREPLTKFRRGLAAEGSEYPWPLLPLLTCYSISGQYERALPVAASMQFLVAACDVFDDVEDADSQDSVSARYGPAVATNVATALLFLGEKSISRLIHYGLCYETIVHVTEVINSLYTVACAGQHLDLSAYPGELLSEAEYLEIISMKSASQIECACRIGAEVANACPELLELFAAFGHNLGMAAQITNDIQGVTRGCDIKQRRLTLPIIYAFAQTKGIDHDQLRTAFSGKAKSEEEFIQIRELLFRIGAVHYATIKLQLYKQQARDVICKAEQMGVNMDWINLFLE